MSGLAAKIAAGRDAVYPVLVISIPCPKCGVPAGDKCLETYSGKTFARATPHAPRIEDAKPKGGA